MKHNLHMLKPGGKSIVPGIVIGVAAAVAVSVLLNMGLTSLVMNGQIEESGTAVLVFMIRAVSVIAGGLVAVAFAKKKSLLVLGLTAAGYLLILIGLGIVCYEGSFQNFLSGVIAVVVGAACACIIKLKPPSKKKHSVKIRK